MLLKNPSFAIHKNAPLTVLCHLGEPGLLAQLHVELVFKLEAELSKLHLLTVEEHVNQHSRQPPATLNHAQSTAVCQDGLNGHLVISNAVEDNKQEQEMSTKPLPTEDSHVQQHSNNNNVTLNLAQAIALWPLGANGANAQLHAEALVL